nr:transposase [Azovibrio restrictus]
MFRGKFVAGLDHLRQQGQLPEALDQAAWQTLKHTLHVHDWVVYAKQPLGGPLAVLDYLGRYTPRVVISNERIIGIANGQAAFRVRADSGGKKRVLRLAGSELIARFLLHLLPSGFKRIRHYGLLSPARKKVGLAAARSALAVPPPEPAIIESVTAFLHRVARLASMCCPHCGGQFRVTATLLPQCVATARGPP